LLFDFLDRIHMLSLNRGSFHMRRKIATVLLSSLAACVLYFGASGEIRGDIILTDNTPLSNALVEAYNAGGTLYGYNQAPEGSAGNPASTSLPFSSTTGFTGTINASMSNSITGNGTNAFTDLLNFSTSTTTSNTDPGTSNQYTTFGEASVQMFVNVTTPVVVTLTLPTSNLGTSTYYNMIGTQSQYLYGLLEIRSTDGSILYGSINSTAQDVNGTSSSTVSGYGYTVLTATSISLTLPAGNYELDGSVQSYVGFAFGANGSVTDLTDGGSILITATPEPASLALLGTGFLAFGGYRLCRWGRRVGRNQRRQEP
jgi:hypothetical protein